MNVYYTELFQAKVKELLEEIKKAGLQLFVNRAVVTLINVLDHDHVVYN